MAFLFFAFLFVVIVAVAAFLLIYFLVIAPGYDAGAEEEGYDYEEARSGNPYVSESTWGGRAFNSGYSRARTNRRHEAEMYDLPYYPPVRPVRRSTSAHGRR
jgi:hypothetical protein